ncbi:MAG: helix-turn-helix domain-containing protein [Candidatus Desulfofervidaceae bacterium]|nr:helix-turn-helix domain-containing protein [Candidatus Desulfofervidaceae bacterium]
MGGTYVYVPGGRKKGKRRREVEEMLRQGKSAQEIAKKVGVSVRYVYWLKAQRRAESAEKARSPG